MLPAETSLWTVADRLPGALLLVDLDGKLVEANGRARRLLGLEGDFPGTALSSRLVESDEELQRYLKICGGSLQPMPGRLTLKLANGETVRHAVSGARVDLEAGDRADVRVVIWSTDAASTSSHARFNSLNTTIEKLTQEVRARRQAEAQLAAEARAKDHFLAVLSHELRNPLSAAVNAVYALEALGEPDEQRAELQSIIVNSTGMLKRILDDLLDLGRLNTGKFGLQLAPLDFSGMIKELVTTFRTTVPDRELRYIFHDDAMWVHGDRARLQQTVHNLVGNALKYSESTDVITIELSGDEHELRFSVQDTGHGIDASLLPEIFTAFVQSDESLDRTDSGLGLGLALVRQFADMHGGSVTAHSEGLGFGSEFVLRLPRLAALGQLSSDNAHADNTQVDNTHADNSSVKDTPRSRQVLVVEDNAEARIGLCRLLERWGHKVVQAGDGEEGLKLMRENPPEIALVDIGLPGISGYDVARTVRSESALAAVTLIALTGYGQEKDRKLTAQVGFDRHLVKPVDRADLIDIFGERVRK